MREPSFKSTATNPFRELVELRIELRAREDQFDIHCKLLFGKMHHMHNERDFEVGIRRAYLRLNLEGCETTLEPVFGENKLMPVVQEEEWQSDYGYDTSLSGSSNIEAVAGAKGQASIGASANRRRSNSQRVERLPMTHKPGDSWEIIAQTIDGSANVDLEGAAMTGQKLCSLQRTSGGNRIAATGEIQVSKSEIRVSVRGGNRLGKRLTEWTNKDAVISQILKRAVQREAVGGQARFDAKVVVIAKAEALED